MDAYLPASARRDIVYDHRVGVYHCIARCVQRAFLCGIVRYTGRDYSYRKAWVLDRLRHLAALFGIEVLLDWTGRELRRDKSGAIPADLAPILDRLGVDGSNWVRTVREFGRTSTRSSSSMECRVSFPPARAALQCRQERAARTKRAGGKLNLLLNLHVVRFAARMPLALASRATTPRKWRRKP
jgi:hypothetical protein